MAVKTYGRLRLDDGMWVMDNVPPQVCVRLKNVFQHVGKTSVQPFRFRDDDDVARDLHWFLQRYPMDMSTKDFAKLVRLKNRFDKTRDAVEKIASGDFTPKRYDLLPGQELRDYQDGAVQIWGLVKSMVLGDSMGLGKTYTTIAAAMSEKVQPMAVVVQSHLPDQWITKFREFSGIEPFFVPGRQVVELPPASVYIFRYSIISSWTDVFATGFFKSVVFDEIQELRRGDETEKGKAARVLCKNTEMQLGLSGTLINNYGIEAWNIFDILKEGCLGRRDEFAREWCSDRDQKVVKDPAALGASLRERKLLLRRSRDDIGLSLPKTTKVVQPVDFDSKGVADQQDLARKLAIKTVSGNFSEKGRAARELDMHVRMLTGIGKAPFVAGLTRMLVESEGPVVLAGWHRDVYDIWLTILADLDPVMYTGSESPAAKRKSFAKFMAGDSGVFIISHGSGAGLDGLQSACSTIVHGELAWSPAIHSQLTERVDRDGQTKPVLSVFPVCDHGSDPMMVEVLGLKSSQAHGLLDPGKSPVSAQTDPDRIRRLAASYLTPAERKKYLDY